MPKPNVFICHRWDYNEDYYKLTEKFDEYGFSYLNYSVPEHDPLPWVGPSGTRAQLAEQVRQCNYFIVFARKATDTEWCKHEVETAVAYGKYILGVHPRGYLGGIPKFIQDADNQQGPISFHTPAIIDRIRTALNWWS